MQSILGLTSLAFKGDGGHKEIGSILHINVITEPYSVLELYFSFHGDSREDIIWLMIDEILNGLEISIEIYVNIYVDN